MTMYSRLLQDVLIPVYYGLRGRAYSRHHRFMEQSQWWSKDQLADFQWRELQRLLEHVFRSVPFYRQKYADAGISLEDIRTREDFAQLPPLTRAELNQHREEIRSANPGGKLITHSTGGSSGVPTRFYITPDSYDWRCAATTRAYAWSGYRLGERCLYLWGAPVAKVPKAKSAKMNAYHALRRELVVQTFSQTPRLWCQVVENAVRFRPQYIVGYVSSLEEFAAFLLSSRTRLRGIRGVIAAAEKVTDQTRELVRKALDAPLFNTYGCREFMSIAAECEEHDGLHINAENLLVETELASDQGPSELLITDLHNYGMPFIRYRIGDVGSISESRCQCGRVLPVIRSIEGRVLEILRTRDGRVIPGEFFGYILKDIDEAREFQVQQTSIDEIVISLVLSRPLPAEVDGMIRQQCETVFGSGTRVITKSVDFIPRLPSGKRRITVGLEGIRNDAISLSGFPK